MLSSKRSPPVVLVVEDELLVRLQAVSIVEDAGFEAVEATNADEAIDILETREDMRIVFTDINMPGSMDGLRLARAIRDRWPPIDFIITSGLVAATPELLPERGHFIRKPYTASQVTQALNELMMP